MILSRKEDAKKLDKQMAQKAHDIGEVLHSKGKIGLASERKPENKNRQT